MNRFLEKWSLLGFFGKLFGIALGFGFNFDLSSTRFFSTSEREAKFCSRPIQYIVKGWLNASGIPILFIYSSWHLDGKLPALELASILPQDTCDGFNFLGLENIGNQVSQAIGDRTFHVTTCGNQNFHIEYWFRWYIEFYRHCHLRASHVCGICGGGLLQSPSGWFYTFLPINNVSPQMPWHQSKDCNNRKWTQRRHPAGEIYHSVIIHESKMELKAQ